jgi:hypothetical protein
MSLLLAALLATAHAEPVDLGELLRPPGHPTPAIALACVPAGSVVEGLSVVPGMIEELMAERHPDYRNPPWFALFDPQHMDELGFREDGTLSLLMWIEEDAGVLTFPFEGGPDQVERLLNSLSEEPFAAGEHGWTTPRDPELLVQLDGDRLLFLLGEPAPLGEPTPAPWLFQQSHQAPLCAIHIDPSSVDRELPAEVGGVSALLPLGDERQVLFRVETKEVPRDIVGVGAVPTMGTSERVPTIAVSIGADPLELFRVPRLAAKLGVDDAQIERLQKRVRLEPGATLAVFMDDPLGFAGIVGVSKPNGRPMPKRKVVRGVRALLEQAELEALEADGVFLVQKMKVTALIRPERGRVVVADSVESFDVLVEGEGQPWLDEQRQDFVGEWPIALFMDPSQSGELNRRLEESGVSVGPFSLGMRAQAGGVELGYQRSASQQGVELQGDRFWQLVLERMKRNPEDIDDLYESLMDLSPDEGEPEGDPGDQEPAPRGDLQDV